MILGLFGEAGAGKDTVADLIEKIFKDKEEVIRTSFAEPVYAIAAALAGVTVEELASRKYKETFRFFTLDNGKVEEATEVAVSYGINRCEFLYAIPSFIDILVENFQSTHSIIPAVTEVPYFIAELYISPRKLLEFVGTELGRNMLDENIWLDIVANKALANPNNIVVVTDVRFPNEVEVVDYLVEVYAPENQFKIQSTHASAAGIPSRLRNDIIVNNQDGLDKLELLVIEMLTTMTDRQLQHLK